MSQHLLADCARHQPGLGDVGVHHVEKPFRHHIDDFRNVILARRDHEDVDPAKTKLGGFNDPFAVSLGGGAPVDWFDLGADVPACDRDLLKLLGFAGGEDKLGSRCGEDLGGQSAKGARSAGYDRDFAAHIK